MPRDETLARLERRLPDWEDIPDFGLYMDQLTTYVERCLGSEPEYRLTPGMINSYVKGGLIARPVGKKYSRESIAQLLMVCALKSATSLDTLRTLVRDDREEASATYARFLREQRTLLKDISPLLSPLSCALRASAYQRLCRLRMEAASPAVSEGSKVDNQRDTGL